MTTSAPIKQEEFKGVDFEEIKDSPLGKATKAYLDKKQELEEANLEIETIRKDVIEQMSKMGKTTIKIAIDGERHIFSIVESKEKLAVHKESKTPRTKEEKD